MKAFVLLSEQWRAVVGFEGLYEVSNLGRIKRLPRTVTCGSRHSSKLYLSKRYSEDHILSPGRRTVKLCADGKSSRFNSIARIVLLAWIGPAPENKPIARHLDDDYSNNKLTNLAWGSIQDNHDDAKRNGRTRKDRHFPGGNRATKLTEAHRQNIAISVRKSWEHRRAQQ